MGFDEGQVLLDSETGIYLAGQTLYGKLRFRQDKVKTFRGIYAQVKGHARVHWTTTHTRKVNDRTEEYTVNHNADEEYFRVKQYLVGSHKGEFHLQPGDHEFPFQCHIPPHCPSSFDGTYGFTRYKIKIVVDRAFKADQEKELIFHVKAPVDLRVDPYCREPLEFSFDDTYCSWCVSAGNCETIIKIPQSGFCVGQTVPVELSCANNSTITINKIKMELVKRTRFYAHSEPGTREEEAHILQLVKGPIPGRTTRSWVLDMEIPMMDPCNLAGCRIIDVDYNLEVKVKTTACHENSEQASRVILGDIALDDTVTPKDGIELPGVQSNQNINQNVPPEGFPMGQVNGYPQPAYPGNPGADPSYPGGVAPYPGGNPPYAGGNQPYPGGNPYAGGNPPYAGGNPPYAGGNPPYAGGNPPYAGGNPPFPSGNPPYAGGNPPYAPYPGNNSYPGSNLPYPGSNPSLNVPYPGNPPSSGNFGAPGVTPPYPGSLPVPLPSDPSKSPTIGFRKPELAPLQPFTTDPTPLNPYATASAPGAPETPAPAQQSPFNPEFMKDGNK